MKQMMSTKGINTLHKYLLLKALVAAIKENNDAEECFDEAILAPAGKNWFYSRCGFWGTSWLGSFS
jgi:hypothetical protein